MKKVSIILPVFNGEKTITNCINSILNQSYNNFELIIINDCSKDNTLGIISKYEDKRIKLFNNNKNYGRSRSKNIGLINAIGEIIIFIEDDAVYSKNYILEGIKYFKSNNVIGVIGPYYVLNKDDNLITKSINYERIKNFKNYKPFSMWFYRKKDLEKIGGFDETLEFGEDVIPYRKLKNKNNKVIYEPNAIWYHMEPNTFKKLIRRKFKGGLGMASLYKKGYDKLKLKLLIAVLLGILFFMIYPIYTLLAFLFLLTLLPLIYINKIIYVKNKTKDNIFYIIIGLYIEYTWKIFTLLGYLFGLLLSNKKIISILKGK